MLYRLIKEKVNKWCAAPDCSVRPLLDYIEQTGKMRDAQIEAIRSFLYLKIACNNKPLWELMYNGTFNSLSDAELDNIPFTASSRNFIKNHPEARALYEFAKSCDSKGEQTAPQLAELIAASPDTLDYETIIKSLFYGVEYTDYLFSIPMGAGKTWLMAAFIYLNLYFALNEPENKLFAHNFIILAPAGLKSSIIPSLVDIQEFDPSFILPEPTSSILKSKLRFELLNEESTSKNSNQIKNPNAVKIQLHQPFNTLSGLVIITNAEKLYDRVDRASESIPKIFDNLTEAEKKEWLKTVQANELRQIIGEVPNLCIMVDEVHHASEEQLLRKVIEKWVAESSFNSVLGFSGTPYLTTHEKIIITDSMKIKNSMLSNVVTYYPLVKAVGNFLKIPKIKSSNISSEDIVRHGLNEFFSKYKDLSYPEVGCAKIAIYCGRIDTLETQVYPLVYSFCQENGLNPEESILKFYGANNKNGFTCSPDAEARFRALDSVFSKVRIVLLVQIGKEGWNCKSLTGVILPNENSSRRNMVLQSSCRCLREVVNAKKETALIWLNPYNEEILENQLRKEHHTSIAEIQSVHDNKVLVPRYSRQEIVKLPKLSYLQLNFTYTTVINDETPINEKISEVLPKENTKAIIHETLLTGDGHIVGEANVYEKKEYIEFFHWLNLISKESFYGIDVRELNKYSPKLRRLFDMATIIDSNNNHYFNPNINQQQLRSDIRKCFSKKETVIFSQENIPREASLLKVESLSIDYFASPDRIIYPPEKEVQEIIDADNPQPIPLEIQNAIDSLIAAGNTIAAEALLNQFSSKRNEINNRTYQYIPYTFDSSLENTYSKRILRAALEIDNTIEGYFNGDESLTEFFIDCYKYDGSYWRNIGKYYPDFLLIKRNAVGAISKVVIIETKGTVFEAAFADKKAFMEDFIKANNENGKTKFDFLYIPESLTEEQQYSLTKQRIEKFLQA